MRRFLYLVLGLIAVSTALAAAVDEEKPHGRVCLSIYEPGPPEKEDVSARRADPAGRWSVGGERRAGAVAVKTGPRFVPLLMDAFADI